MRRKPASTLAVNAWILTCSQPREQQSCPAQPAWLAAGGPAPERTPRHLLPRALTGLTWALPAREGMKQVRCNHLLEDQETLPPSICQHSLPERAPHFKAVTRERRGFALLLCVRRLCSRAPLKAGETAWEDGSGEERVKAELLQPGCALHPLPSSHLFLDCLPGKRT